MRKRNRTFNPTVQLDRKSLKQEIDILRKNFNALSASHNLHIALLSNFMGHDIKNCVQSIDAVLCANTADELTEDHVESIKQQLAIIRENLANFSELNPHGTSGLFKINSLIGSTEALNRDLLKKSGVRFSKELLGDIELFVNYPFHSLLQVLNNLITNACTHLNNKANAAVLLRVSVDQKKKRLFLSLYDNGLPISEKEQALIFDYGYSATGGSGIGLYHAQYVCHLLGGSVRCLQSDKPEFVKYFQISLPFRSLDDE